MPKVGASRATRTVSLTSCDLVIVIPLSVSKDTWPKVTNDKIVTQQESTV